MIKEKIDKKSIFFQSMQTYIINMWSRWYGMLSSARFDYIPFYNIGIEYDPTTNRPSFIHV